MSLERKSARKASCLRTLMPSTKSGSKRLTWVCRNQENVRTQSWWLRLRAPTRVEEWWNSSVAVIKISTRARMYVTHNFWSKPKKSVCNSAWRTCRRTNANRTPTTGLKKNLQEEDLSPRRQRTRSWLDRDRPDLSRSSNQLVEIEETVASAGVEAVAEVVEEEGAEVAAEDVVVKDERGDEYTHTQTTF